MVSFIKERKYIKIYLALCGKVIARWTQQVVVLFLEATNVIKQ